MVDGMQNTTAGDAAEPIAIVGAGCRLPGNVSTVDDLLQALREGRDCITDIPSERWNIDEYYDEDSLVQGKTYVRQGGFLRDIDRFDAGFFGISDGEASRMDPQQRILLQTVWHALEHAGQSSEDLYQSDTGVFLAMMNTNGYAQLKGMFGGLQGVTAYDAMGDAMSITAGRVAHFLGLEGPCLALDTACSGSMVALHQARLAILAGECESAIVAGVGTILHPGVHIAFSKIGLMSRSGRCRAFDAAADGYIRGEGCVAVILRRQSLAEARGDHILASIVGTAINHDGRTPALTAPNGQAQERVMRMALARVGVSPYQIGYVEAHGTGTPVGDPIEMGALANVFGPGRGKDETLYVGSVKSNFGHIEAGAGLLGLLKTSLALDSEEIFPSLHFNRLNPNIDLGQAPIEVASSRTPWPRGKNRRMAGVNSFGYSGTNAHAILQESPVHESAETETKLRPSEMILLSAKSTESLEELVDSWVEFLEKEESPSLPDIAFVAATGRAHMTHRLGVVGAEKGEIAQKLRAWRDGRMPARMTAGQVVGRRKAKIAFVFTGQGSQYSEMGREIYESEPRFRSAIERCAAIMDSDLGVPLTEVLFGSDSATYLADTRYVQPAIFAVEYALVDLFRHWGIEPDMVVGHSVGEIVAACVAGVLDLDDAARFVVARGRLMGQSPQGGRMVSIRGNLRQVQEWIRGRESQVSIAAVNGPMSVVISGYAEGVDEVERLAQEAGLMTKGLTVSHAFHSPLMDSILGELAEVGESLRISPSRIPIVSNVTGELYSDEVNGEYWASHVRQAVQFHQGMCKVVDEGCSVLVEIGPHANLTPAIASAFDAEKARCIPTLNRDKQDVTNLLQSLSFLHVGGTTMRLDRLFWSPSYRRVSVPLYPFRKKRYWLANDLSYDKAPEIQDDLHPLLGRVMGAGSRRVVFETSLTAAPPWSDHRVLESTVFPATGYLDMVSRGLIAFKGEDWLPIVFRDVNFERPLLLRYGKKKAVTLTIEDISANEGFASFTVGTDVEGRNEIHCRGKVGLGKEDTETVCMEELLARKGQELPIGHYYADLRKSGLEYGASFATVRELWVGAEGSREAIGRVELPLAGGADNPFLNSVLLDGALHTFGAALRSIGLGEDNNAYIPASIRMAKLNKDLPSEVWSHASLTLKEEGRSVLATVQVLSESGEVLVDLDGIELRHKTSLRTSSAPSGATQASGNGKTSSSSSQTRKKLLDQLQSKDDRGEQVAILAQWLTVEVKDLLGQAAEGMDLESVEPTMAFIEIGLDSLLITELQRQIQETLEIRFDPMEGLDYQSIESLADYILDKVLGREGGEESQDNLQEVGASNPA
ncbi:MAG: beta-ketoacyl synthase N-terminal-like domain-containing protein [Planctomycetota bacterium]|jgi:acyl transferase domain-containing protein|nr:beta-ketoacyl synthase N-terminal-like domain-containing protein [Planctomycetota bacterium]